MIYEPYVFAAFAAALALPGLPAAFELFSPRDASALVLDPEYAMDPRYLGKSFRRKIAGPFAETPLGAEIEFLARANERARIVGASTIPAGSATGYAVLARGPVTIGEDARLTDVYSTGPVQVSSGASMRTLVADGDITVAANVSVARWIDTERHLTIGANSRIGHSASAGGRCTLAESVVFQRLFGDPVVVGVECAAVAPPVWNASADGDTITAGDVEIAANTVHNGSIKCGGNVLVRAGACVFGSIVARGNVRLERFAGVAGHIFSERDVLIGEHASIGSAGSAKTVYASHDVRLAQGAAVYGWIICEGEGETE